jgi:hypothetical protein
VVIAISSLRNIFSFYQNLVASHPIRDIKPLRIIAEEFGMFRNWLVLACIFSCALVFADPSKCIYPLRHLNGLTTQVLSQNYLLQTHKTLAGELDPFVLGDGGVVTATWLADFAPTRNATAPVFFILFEKDSSHPFTTAVHKAYYTGWPYVILNRTCVKELTNKKQIAALQYLVVRHMNPPKGSQFKYFSVD